MSDLTRQSNTDFPRKSDPNFARQTDSEFNREPNTDLTRPGNAFREPYAPPAERCQRAAPFDKAGERPGCIAPHAPVPRAPLTTSGPIFGTNDMAAFVASAVMVRCSGAQHPARPQSFSMRAPGGIGPTNSS